MRSMQSLFPDGVHPNAAGADTIAHIFQRTLFGPVANRFQAASFAAAGGNLPYRIFMPEAYSAKEKYPLILALHGAGERGSDNKAQIAVHRVAEIWAEDSTQKKQKSFVVAPQCPSNQQWVDVAGWDKVYTSTATMPISAPLAKVVKLVDSLVKALPIDTNRIYVTGLSMGGYGTWDLIERYPGKFAAAVPLSGGCDTSKSGTLKGFPVWTFHGALDPVVPPHATRAMVARFKAQGEAVTDYTAKYASYFANATITRQALTAAIDGGAKKLYGEYTDGAHDIWSATYDDPLVARWLFKQTKTANGTGIAAFREDAARRGSLLVFPGDDMRAVAAALAPGAAYSLRVTDVKGEVLARATVKGGAPLPASLAPRARGLLRIAVERL
jgi:poly(3-hydroxybutyrate) depolymerase